MLIIIWLVVEPYPSEQYEHQLGLWHSQYMASHKSDVPNHQPVWRFPEKWCYPNIWMVYFMDNPILIAGWELRGTATRKPPWLTSKIGDFHSSKGASWLIIDALTGKDDSKLCFVPWNIRGFLRMFPLSRKTTLLYYRIIVLIWFKLYVEYVSPGFVSGLWSTYKLRCTLDKWRRRKHINHQRAWLLKQSA